jgi:uncharacterized membrane protein YgcG
MIATFRMSRRRLAEVIGGSKAIYGLAMKSLSRRLFLAVLAMGWSAAAFATPAQADEAWIIDSFHSDIQIAADSSISVTEDIRVDFGSLQKHGIFRTIPVRSRYDSSHARYYGFSLESVTDGSRPVPHELSGDAYNDTIKIGDPNLTVSGPQRYVITYRYIGVMNAFSDHDELYWNVDGGSWPVPKKSVSATVTFPAGSFQKAACYEGPTGSNETCTLANSASTATFTSTRQLGSGEQMSLVTALNKGAVTVAAPTLESRLRDFPQGAFDINPLTVGVSILVLVAGIGLIVRFWWLHGRDRAYLTQYYLTNDTRDHAEPAFSHEPVVVEFGPPQNLRPAQLGLILDESADTKDVTATIIDLAVRGYLTINEVPDKKDWLLEWRQGAAASALLPYEKTLLDGLFAGGRQQVKISELKGTFQTTLRSAESQVYSDAMSRKLFRFRPDYMRGIAVFFAILGILAGAGVAYGLGVLLGWGLVGIAVILASLVLLVMHRVLSTRTAAGRDVMQHSLGFRLYMTTAEKYRQQFAEKAEIFTQLLPYAIVFGCVSRWAKAFEGLDTAAASGWYVGNRPFQAAFLASNLESMNSSLSSAMSSTPASSGSSGFGGGGFSGGGGGGGGGGSW